METPLVLQHRSSLVAATRYRLGLLLGLLGCACVAAPTVTESPGQVVVSNAHFTATFSNSQGGALTELRSASGQTISTGHALYTDWGIYPDRTYYGTAHAPAQVAAVTEGGRAVIRSEGVLCRADGTAPTEPGTIAYWLQYTISDDPDLRIEWGATPGFSKSGAEAFYSYVLTVPACIGIFANTEAGVLFQDMADQNTRTYQSAHEPLHPRDPWLGLMRSDTSVVAFTDLQSMVPWENVFYHEDGRGNAGVFFAWLCGQLARDLQAGKEWRGAVTLQLAESFEAFLAGRDQD